MRSRRLRGESWRTIGEALDVEPWTLQRWLRRWPEPEEAGLRPVAVVDDSKSTRPARATESTILMSTAELQLFLEGSAVVFMSKLSPDDLELDPVVSRPLSPDHGP